MADEAGAGAALDDPDVAAAVATSGSAEGSTAVDALGGGETDTKTGDDRAQAGRPVWARLDVVALVVVLMPFVVSAVALVAGPGGSYLASADHAAQELAVRDIGSHPVLVGLYSRGNWSHPGPLLFYLLAPFYWLSGRNSIGLDIGALAINAASIAGMALIARRRGGLPLMLITLAGCALVARTLAADFLHDPWVCYITTLPFALLILLSWAATCGERWALPAAVFVASFLAQTHIGFLLLAPPFVVWGAAGLLVPAWRSRGADRDRLRALVRTGGVSALVLAVAWLPPFLDWVFNAPSNVRRIWQWFGDGEEFGIGLHTPADGWRVITAQFGIPPEWLIDKHPGAFPLGEPVSLYEGKVPWLLIPVAVAVWALWRRATRWRDGRSGGADGGGGSSDGIRLAATLGLSLLVGIVAIARTIGPVFDYRLRWTWMPPMVAFVVTAWAAWLAVRDRWPGSERRWLVPGAVVLLTVVSGVNVVTAASTGMPYPGDTGIVATLTPDVLDAVDEDGGVVVIDAPYTVGMWWARGVVIELEQRGIEVRVTDAVAAPGEHRLYDYGEERVQAWLVFVRDRWVDTMRDSPDMELVTRWSGPPTGALGARDVAVFLDHARSGRVVQRGLPGTSDREGSDARGSDRGRSDPGRSDRDRSDPSGG